MRGPEPSRPGRRTRQALWGAALLTLAGLAFWINAPLAGQLFDGSAQRVSRLPRAARWHAGQRLLVLAPHPDDETLCCAGMIQQAQAAGAQVWIAWVTAGDGFEFDAALTQRVLRPGPAGMRRLGLQRMEEARRAAALLGVPAQRTFMLGFPDGGLFSLFTTHYVQPYTARRAGAAGGVPAWRPPSGCLLYWPLPGRRAAHGACPRPA
ncbi:PIG-L family deacetylase [Deinococcus navajonensis]|uniref:PIG-L family deacetylase n=1 Tax=Deinococcus navajonensis TaxID=309884 RepID=A0ABV8XKZ1_9DEIO